MLKVKTHMDYSPKEGRYISGNDASPVAVTMILYSDADKIPPEIENLVRAGIESGASFSGTFQTENIGFEKIITEDIEAQLRERFQSTWSGCLGGAIIEEDYWKVASKAGFTKIQIVACHTLTLAELKAMACCPGEEFTPPPNKEDIVVVEGKVGSVKFTAEKPPLL